MGQLELSGGTSIVIMSIIYTFQSADDTFSGEGDNLPHFVQIQSL